MANTTITYTATVEQKQQYPFVFFGYGTSDSDSDASDSNSDSDTDDSSSGFDSDESGPRGTDADPWLTRVDAQAFRKLGSKEKFVGSAVAWIIDRPSIRRTWTMLLDEYSEEFREFSTKLWNPRGLFLHKLYNDAKLKGTGVFGPELGQGRLLYVESVTVEAKYRRRGIGTNLLRQLHSIASKKDIEFVFCWPTALESNFDDKDCVRFMRQTGSRRVGRTKFFCYALSATHPSRSLSIRQDVKELVDPMTMLAEDELQKKHPFHWTVMTGFEVPQILSTLRKLPRVGMTNPPGHTLLHLAAERLMPEVVSMLLQSPAIAKDINKRDWRGRTALEVAKEANGGTSSFDIIFSLQLQAFDNSTPALKTIEALSDAMGTPLTPESRQRIKQGCTCGNCVGGFLSARMRYEMVAHAEIQSDMIDGDIVDKTYNEYTLPVDHRYKRSTTFGRGFTAVLRLVAACIQQGIMPSTANLDIAVNKSFDASMISRNFFAKGGDVSLVLGAIFEVSQEDDRGDGSHDEFFTQEIGQLPECRNDKRFGLVHSQLLQYPATGNIPLGIQHSNLIRGIPL